MSCKKNNKLPYEKPRLRAIELLGEEVLGAGCKQTGVLNNISNSILCEVGGPCSANANPS